MTKSAWLQRHSELSALVLAALAWTLLLAPDGLGLRMGISLASRPNAALLLSAPAAAPDQEASLAGVATPRTNEMPSMSSQRMYGARQMTGRAGSRRPHARPTDSDPRTGSMATMGWTFPMFALMLLAMMLPTTAGPVRQVAARSLWRRRRRAVAEWLSGYVGVWLAAGAAILGMRAAVVSAGLLTPGPIPLLVGLILAGAWQLTPIKRSALNGCHATRPLAPRGVRADRDCLLSGVTIGQDCVVSCGPMMTAMTLGSGSNVLVMAGLTLIVLIERFRYRTPRRTSAVALIVLAAVAV